MSLGSDWPGRIWWRMAPLWGGGRCRRTSKLSHRKGPDQTQTQTCLAGPARVPGLAVRLENIFDISVLWVGNIWIFKYFCAFNGKYFNISNITFSLHSHLEAFLQPAVLTLVPDKKVTDWLTDWHGVSTCDVGQWDSSCFLCTDKLDFVWQTAWRNSYSLKLKHISQLFLKDFSVIFQ